MYSFIIISSCPHTLRTVAILLTIFYGYQYFFKLKLIFILNRILGPIEHARVVVLYCNKYTFRIILNRKCKQKNIHTHVDE